MFKQKNLDGEETKIALTSAKVSAPKQWTPKIKRTNSKLCWTFAPKEGLESRCVECVKTCRGERYCRCRYGVRRTRQIEGAEVYKGRAHTSSSYQWVYRQGPVLVSFYKFVGEVIEPRQPWHFYNIAKSWKLAKVQLTRWWFSGLHQASGACQIHGHIYYRWSRPKSPTSEQMCSMLPISTDESSATIKRTSYPPSQCLGIVSGAPNFDPGICISMGLTQVVNPIPSP